MLAEMLSAIPVPFFPNPRPFVKPRPSFTQQARTSGAPVGRTVVEGGPRCNRSHILRDSEWDPAIRSWTQPTLKKGAWYNEYGQIETRMWTIRDPARVLKFHCSCCDGDLR